MLHRQWPDHRFPISHIAYYVLLKRRNISVPDAVIALPDPSIASLLPTQPQPLQESLAGLAFNVDASLGMQLVLRDRIFRALASGDPDRVDALAQGYDAGFWAVLDDTANLEVREASGEELEKAICCSVNSKTLLAEGRKSEAAVLFERLADRAVAPDTTWPSFGSTTGDALAKLAGLLGKPGITPLIAESVRRTGSTEEDGERAIKDGFLEGIRAFVLCVREIGHSHALEKPFPVGGNAARWITDLTELLTQNKESDYTSIWPHLRPMAKPETIVTALAETVSGGKATAILVEIVKSTDCCPVQFDWSPLALACRQRLDQAQNAKGEEADALLRVLLYLHRVGNTKPLTELVNQGHICHCLHHNPSKADLGCRIRCLASTMLINASLAKPKTVGNSDAGHSNLLELISKDVEEDAAYLLAVLLNELHTDLLFETIEKRGKFDKLFSATLRLLADDELHCTAITTGFLHDKWPDILDEINTNDPDRLTRLIDGLAAKGSLIEDLQSTDFDIKHASLYRRVVAATKSSDVIGWCVNGLNNVSQEDWASALRGRNELIDLVMALGSTGFPPPMPHAYLDALVAFAEQMMLGDAETPDRFTEQRIDSFDLLQSDDQKADFRLRCADDMTNQGGNIVPAFFEQFGEHMLVPERFRNDRAVSELFSGIVTARNVAGLKWLRRLLNRDSRLIDSASTEIANVFRDRLRTSSTKRCEDESDSLLIEIAGAIHVDLPQPSEEDEPNNGEEVSDVPANSQR
jgi:hypothetical protein